MLFNYYRDFYPVIWKVYHDHPGLESLTVPKKGS
jgi:hypothetical protein